MARPLDLGTEITSTTNPKVKRLVRLAERRDRDEEGVFLVEGTRAIERFLATGRPLLELYVAPDWFDEAADLCWSLIALAQGVGTSVQALSRDAFAKCAYRERPEGLVGVARQWVDDLSDLVLSPQPLLLVAEGIEKPGNLGSLLRSADAAGCEAVILCNSRVDRFNPNVIRSSTGVVFSMPIVTAGRTAITEFLKRHNIVSVATTPDTPTSLYDVDLTSAIAVVVGSEDTGLSDEWLNDSDICVRLPMLGQADSLNVAMATVVTLYEVVRQRQAGSTPSVVRI
jgi:RNA methyltransferase, TrmH family